MPTAAANEQHDPIRIHVRHAVEHDLAVIHPALKLGDIDPAALSAVREWTGRAVTWDWAKITKVKRDARLDVAIWSGVALCGVAWGSVTARWVSINWLEGNPGPANALRGYVTKIAVALMETHAHVLGCRETRIVGPVPLLVSYYEEFGYHPVLAKSGIVGYMVKDLP